MLLCHKQDHNLSAVVDGLLIGNSFWVQSPGFFDEDAIARDIEEKIRKRDKGFPFAKISGRDFKENILQDIEHRLLDDNDAANNLRSLNQFSSTQFALLVITSFHKIPSDGKCSLDVLAKLRELEHEQKLRTVVLCPVKRGVLKDYWFREDYCFSSSNYGDNHEHVNLDLLDRKEISKVNGAKELTSYERSLCAYPALLPKITSKTRLIANKDETIKEFFLSRLKEHCMFWTEKILEKLASIQCDQKPENVIRDLDFYDWFKFFFPHKNNIEQANVLSGIAIKLLKENPEKEEFVKSLKFQSEINLAHLFRNEQYEIIEKRLDEKCKTPYEQIIYETSLINKKLKTLKDANDIDRKDMVKRVKSLIHILNNFGDESYDQELIGELIEDLSETMDFFDSLGKIKKQPCYDLLHHGQENAAKVGCYLSFQFFLYKKNGLTNLVMPKIGALAEETFKVYAKLILQIDQENIDWSNSIVKRSADEADARKNIEVHGKIPRDKKHIRSFYHFFHLCKAFESVSKESFGYMNHFYDNFDFWHPIRNPSAHHTTDLSPDKMEKYTEICNYSVSAISKSIEEKIYKTNSLYLDYLKEGFPLISSEGGWV